MLVFVATALGCAATAAAAPSLTLPTVFVADRVYVVPRTADGMVLKLYTDTGGGLFITEPATRRLKLDVHALPRDADADASLPPTKLAKLPRFEPGFSIPLPTDNDGQLAVMPAATVEKNRFDADGMLGAAWFGNHVWTWDYPSERLTREAANWKADGRATRLVLGFPTKNGARAGNFARIGVRIDGKPIDLLLDTGATTRLGPEALATLGDHRPAQRATSFIVDAQFRAWRAAHPDWRVIEKADLGKLAMIRFRPSRSPAWMSGRSGSPGGPTRRSTSTCRP